MSGAAGHAGRVGEAGQTHRGGCYLVLEGADGCGKSAQAARLVQHFAAGGRAVLHVREPGSTPLGEALRRVLLDPGAANAGGGAGAGVDAGKAADAGNAADAGAGKEMGAGAAALSPLAEALLFTAARVEMLRAQVAPALARGEVVVAERCFLSTLVYQGLAPGAGEAVALRHLLELQEWAHGELWPDAIFVLDVDAITAHARCRRRAPDRIEARGDEYHERVRGAFRDLARGDAPLPATMRPLRLQLIDARGTLDDVQAELRRLAEAVVSWRGAS